MSDTFESFKKSSAMIYDSLKYSLLEWYIRKEKNARI